MKYLNRHPLSINEEVDADELARYKEEMALKKNNRPSKDTHENLRDKVQAELNSSTAFGDILALAEEKIPYQVTLSGKISLISRKYGHKTYKMEDDTLEIDDDIKGEKVTPLTNVFGQTTIINKNDDGTWKFEIREYGKKVEGEGYKLVAKTESYNTLENCLRHLWSYLIARKIDTAFDRAAKRKDLNDPNEQKYWGQKMTLANILSKEETLLDKKAFANLIEDFNDKFNQFGMVFQYTGERLGSCIISNDLSAIRGSLLALLVNNKPKMAILNKNIRVYITNSGEKSNKLDFLIMPRNKREAYNLILRAIISTYSDPEIADKDTSLGYIKNLIVRFAKLNLENPNLPKPHTLFDLYKAFYNEMDLVPLLILSKLELREIIPPKVSQGYRDDIDDFISRAGSNKYTFNLIELYEDMKMYLMKDSGINTIDDFRAYIIGVIHNLGLKTNIVKSNVMISIP